MRDKEGEDEWGSQEDSNVDEAHWLHDILQTCTRLSRWKLYE
jgi:hypothetical protein